MDELLSIEDLDEAYKSTLVDGMDVIDNPFKGTGITPPLGNV